MNNKDIFNNFKNNTILIIGDVMLDSYIIGDVNRISPEAPVPVVDVSYIEKKLGGAANVALNLKKLGATPIMCSVIGNDLNGEEIEKLFLKNDLIIDFLYKSKYRKTTNKTRIIGNNTQLIRIDEEISNDLNNDDNDKLLNSIMNSFSEYSIDAIIFEDYDKGVISKKLIDEITKYCLLKNIPIFTDPKFKNFNNYNNCSIFKPNLKEFEKGLNINIKNFNELKVNIEKLIIDKNFYTVYVTMGDDGIMLSYKDENDIIKHEHIKGRPINISDVSGAGDTVISVATLLSINGLDKINIANIANIAGSIVCEKKGVVPIDLNELLLKI